MSNPAKAKGTAFETAIVNELRSSGLYAIKPRQEGFKDLGDIHVEGLITLQAKNYKDVATGLRNGVDGAQVQRVNAGLPYAFAVIKRARKPVGESYVVMRLADFPAVVRALQAHGADSLPDKELN